MLNPTSSKLLGTYDLRKKIIASVMSIVFTGSTYLNVLNSVNSDQTMIWWLRLSDWPFTILLVTGIGFVISTILFLILNKNPILEPPLKSSGIILPENTVKDESDKHLSAVEKKNKKVYPLLLWY